MLWADWGKQHIRDFARAQGLPNWDEPSEACLASRVAHGQEISAPLLTQIADSERWFHARGFRRVRVRIIGRRARVEVDPHETARLVSEPFASEARAELLRQGFSAVDLDPVGYRARAGG